MMLSFFLIFLNLATSTSATTNENFLDCFKTNNISELIIYSPSNSTYPSLLQSHSHNLRYTTTKYTTPEFIITPTQKSHVSITVTCTKNSGFRLKTRSGGHDFEGLSYISNDPFVILDMFNLRNIEVNVNEKTVYVESGAILGELYYKISEFSKLYGFPAGICPTVGIGGHISGGGYGNMLRKFGLSVDNVIDAEIVDFNGRILDYKSMGDDLFWVIKGGGGASFGVLLSYTLKLVDVPEVVTVFRVERFQNDYLSDVVYKWQEFMYNVDENLFIRLILQPVTSDQGFQVIRVTFMSLFLGGVDELMVLMSNEFPELDLKRNDCFEMSWIESVLFWANYDLGTSPNVLLNRESVATYFKRKSDYVMKPISKSGLDLLWEKIIELDGPGLVFNPYGGKMREISSSETPFPHRDGNLYKIQYSISWKDGSKDVETSNLERINELYEFMTPFVSNSPRSAYLNYRDLDIGVAKNYSLEEGKVYGEKYFKGNFMRLVEVKSRVDSENFFRNEQSIPIVSVKSSCHDFGMASCVVYFTSVFVVWFSCCNLL